MSKKGSGDRVEANAWCFRDLLRRLGCFRATSVQSAAHTATKIPLPIVSAEKAEEESRAGVKGERAPS